MTHKSMSTDAYSTAVIDSLAHTPWAVLYCRPTIKVAEVAEKPKPSRLTREEKLEKKRALAKRYRQTQSYKENKAAYRKKKRAEFNAAHPKVPKQRIETYYGMTKEQTDNKRKTNAEWMRKYRKSRAKVDPRVEKILRDAAEYRVIQQAKTAFSSR